MSRMPHNWLSPSIRVLAVFKSLLIILLAATRRALSSGAGNAQLASIPVSLASGPVGAHHLSAEYLDGLFANTQSSRLRLTGNFSKQSRTLVAFMCFERAELIRTTLTALLASDGIQDVDLLVSQDGDSSYRLDVPIPPPVNSLYIRHPVNLCPGQHHFFVKRFAFDIMGYDNLIVAEEDNTVHPQALKILLEMLELSVPDPEIGLVAITDLDNTLLFDENKYAAAVLRLDVDVGHLWVYGLHKSRFKAVKEELTDYYNVIKGRDYQLKHLPPLRDDIIKLMASKAMPRHIPLSQDSFFVNTLAAKGYLKRLSTLVRLLEPLGWEGLHSKWDKNSYYSLFGKGMYEGRINRTAFDVTKDADALKELERECRERLRSVYQQYLGRDVEGTRSDEITVRLLTGTINAVEMVRDIINSAEHRQRLKDLLKGKAALSGGGDGISAVSNGRRRYGRQRRLLV